MNHLCYKTIFSKRLGTLVAVGEHACSQSKGQGASSASGAAGFFDARFVGTLALGFASVSLGWSQTLPQGAQVVQGVVSVSQSGHQMAITQSTPKAVVNWQSFDIGQNAKVNVLQPSSQSVLLNRVLSDNPTQILGQLQANGQVVLVNPKGIVVGSDGSVSASAFTASTLNISDADFMAGNMRYTRDGSTGQVINKGRIEVAPGGYVALLGAGVSNEGQIIAPQGGVALGAADTVTVPLGRTGKIKLELSPASINAAVANQKGGVIVAEGGQVYLQAAALGQAVASVLNSGSIDTSGVQAGAVHLLADGGQIKVDGRITANSSGTDHQGQGLKGGDIYIGRDEETGVLAKATDVSGAKLESAKGFVETSGDFLKTDQVSVKAREWLLDPTNITIAASGASGTAYDNNYAAASDSVILASDINASLDNGTSVTIATTAAGASAGNIAVNESISKTGGGNASLTLQAHANITVANGKTISSNSGALNVLFNANSVNTGGAITLGTGSGITSNGGNITLGGGTALNGTGFATADGTNTFQGISLNTATINAGGGNIVMNGLTPTSSALNVVGISMSGGAITTTGAGQITLTGKNQLNGTTGGTGTGFSMSSGTITGGSTGAVTIEGNSSTSSVTSVNNKGAIINGTVTSTGGNISITGFGGAGAQYDNGVDIGGSVLGVGSANITITGTAASGSSGGNVGVTTSGTATVSSVNGNINITGTGGTGNGALIRNHGVSIIGSKAISSSGTGNITIKGTATNVDNGFSLGVNINSGGVTTNTGSIKIDGAGAANYQTAVNLNAAIRSTAGGDIYVRSSGANISNTSAGTISGNNVSIDNTNGSIDSLGVITPGSAGARNSPAGAQPDGVFINGAVTATNNLRINGRNTHTAAPAGAGISTGTASITAKNMYLVGTSAFGNGIKVVGSTLSSHYYNVLGTSTSGVNGVALQSSLIKTTGTNGFSTESIIKATSTAIPANGYGAFMGYQTNTVEAVTGTKMTLLGEGTTTSAGANTKERGFFLQNGYTLNLSGDITLEGTSKSAEGLSIGGVLNVTGANSKLTIKGTAAATSNANLNALNFSGTLNNNGTNTQPITFIGEAKNLSGTSIDTAVNISGTVNGGTANVNVQAKYGKIGISAGTAGAAINGANISIDNTFGTIDATTGAITEGAGTSNYTNAIDVSGALNVALNASGNVNILGKVANTAHTGVNTATVAAITGTGTAANINITSNGSLVNSAALKLTGATGTGSNINLTSTSGNISGTGAIGDTTNKNANVTFTQGTTSIYGGPINAANFTKSGAGALTLDSWVATTPLPSNVSNAYTVKSGSLTLSPGKTYAWVAPSSVNVENTSVFSLFADSNSRWNNTAFNFTGGLGGGTMNLLGNPIGASSTTNTISTSGGATNTITGTLNANSANVNINLTTASSGTTLVDGSYAALAFTQSTTHYGLGSAGGGANTVTVNGGGNLLVKDKMSAVNFNISTGNVQFGDGTAAAATSTPELQATNVNIATGSKLIFNRAEAHTNTSVFTGPGNLIQAGSGTMTLTGNSSSFAGATTVNAGKTLALGTGGSLGAAGSTVTLVDSASQLHFTGASGVSSVGSTINGAGKVTQSGAGTTILLADNSYAGTTAVSGGTLQVGNAGTTGTLGAGDVTMSNNANLRYVLAEATTITNNISGAGNVSADITGTTSDLTVNRTIALTGGTVNLNADRNLSVTQAISTTNGTSSAVMLVAGKPASAGTATGGDVTITGSGSVSAGASGRVTFMTGSLAGSTGVGAVTGNNRYNSDEVDTNYTAALASGVYTIYREQPLVTVQVNNASKTYDGLGFTGGSLSGAVTSGALIKGDTFAAVTANAAYAGTSQGAKNASLTTYEISGSDAGGKSALGYGVTYTPGALTVNKANLTVTANNDARFVGRTDNTSYAGVSYAGFVNGETPAVLGGTLAITRTNSDMGAGVYANVLSANGLTSGNYNIAYNPGTYTIVPANQLLIKTANNTVTYGTAPVYLTTAQYLDGNSDEIISLTRTGAGNNYTFDDGLGTTVNATLKPYAGTSLAGTSTSGNTVVGTYSIKDLNPIVNGGNFVGAPVFVGNLTVNTQEITPNASGVTKVYDATTAMSNVVVGLTGKLNADNVSISGSGAFSQKHAGTGLGYTVSNITLSGADASNYHLAGGTSSFSGTDGIITPATLKLTSSNVIKTYDGTTSALGSAVATQSTQLLGTDTVSGGTFSFTNKNASTGDKVVTVSGVTLNDGNNGGNYSVTYVDNTTSTINKASLTLKAVTDSKTYDGTIASDKIVEVINASGSSDVVTVAQEFSSKNALGLNASTLKLISGYTIKDTGGADMSGNYTVTTQTATGTILKKDVTLDSITAANKIYDGGNTASITSGAITTGVGSETLIIGGSGAFADKHVADEKIVTVSDVTALSKTDGSGSWANYNLTTTGALSTTASITPRALSLSAVSATKTYDGTTSSSGTVAVSGNQVGDTITASQVFDSKHALGTGASTLKVDTFSINDGNDGKNYSVTQNTATGTIQKASLTVTASQVEKTYDGTTSATGTGTVGTLAGQAAGEVVNAAGSQAFVSKHASTGDKYVKASGVTIKDSANADVTQNYDIHYVDNTTSTIHKANLSVAMSNQTKVYDGTTQASLAAGAITATGITVNGVTETVSVTQTTGSYNDKNVANANAVTVTLEASHFTSGTADVSNYNLPTTVSNTSSTITKANLAVTLANQTKVYDGTNQASLAAGAITATGVTVGGVTETATVTQTVGSYNSKNVASANTVTAHLAAGQFTAGTADLGNYKLPTTVSNTTSTITQAALTLTANSDTSKVYNGSEQSVSGFVITSGSLQGTDSLAVDLVSITAGAQATHAGTHTSTVNDSAYTNGNYAITKVNGTLFIDQKEVSLAAAKTYDGSKTLTGTQLNITTGVGSETLGYTLATIHSKNVGDNSSNFVDAVSLSNGSNGGLASNYKLPALTATGSGNTVVLTAKALSASIADVNTTYGSATATGAVSLSGKVGTDDVLAASTATLVSAATSTSGQIRAGSYVQTVSAGLTGADAGNYSFAGSTTPTANYVVNKLALTGAIAQGLSTYSNTLVAGAVSLTNTVSGDDVLASGVNIDTTGKTSTSGHLKAGVHTGIQTLTGLTGADKDNYTFADIKGDYKVNQLALTGTIAKGETVYGASLLTGAVNLTNKVGTDMVDASGVSIDTTGKTSTSGKLKAGEHTGIQTLSGLTGTDKDNYTFADVKGDYKVNKLALTGSIAQGESIYGSALQAGAVTLSNKVGTDVVDASGVIVDTTDKTSTSGKLKAGMHTGVQTLTGLTGADMDNYTFADIKGDYKVNKLALTGSIAQGLTTYGDALVAGTVTLINKVGTDMVDASGVTIDTTGKTSTSGKLKAGEHTGIQTLTGLTGVDMDNYTFADVKGDYTVNKLALSGTIAKGETVYGSALQAGAVTLSNKVGTDVVDASGVSIATTGKTSTSGKLKAGEHTGIQTLTGLTGADMDNYTFADVKGDYTVNKLALTGSIAQGLTTYGDALVAGTVTLSNKVGTDVVDASGVIVDTTNKTSTSGHLKAGVHTGVQTLTGLTGADMDNYTFADIKGDYKVNKLALTVASIADVSTTYATAADAGVVSFGNKQGADKVTASASIVGGTNSTSGHLKASSYKQTATAISGDDAGNYSFESFTTTDNNYVVNKLALTGAAIAGVSTTYATAANTGAVSFANVQGGDKVTASASIVGGENSSSGHLQASSYQQTATTIGGDDSANYSFGGFTTTDNNYVVNKLALTGAAIAGVTTTYATAANAGAVSFTNIQGTDKVTASASIVDTATSTSGHLKAGSYQQTATAISGDDAANYSFAGVTTTDNNYVVNKLALTGAAIAGVSTTYATAANTGAVSFTNVQGTDKVTASASIVGGSNSTSGHLKAGSYQQTATAINGDDAANYSFGGVTTTDNNYVVNKLALTGAAIAGVTTTYATAANPGAVSFTNVQGTDKVAASASIVDTATSTSGNLKAGSYNQTATSISGDDAANYSFGGVTTTDNNYVVNKLVLSGAAIAGVTTTYATAANAGAVSFTNVQGTDKVLASASIVDTATSTSGHLKAGSYKQTATAISGDDAANYSFGGITTAENNYVVNKLALTDAAIAGVTTTYATAADAGAVSFGNVKGADQVTASASIVGGSNSTSGNLKAGSYQQTATSISGDDATNYSFAGITTTDNNYVVNKLALTGAAIAGVTTTYATAADVGAVSFTNVQGADKVTASASIVGGSNSTSGNLKAGSYKQTATAISGDDSANYSFAGVTTTDNNYVVNKLDLSGAAIAGVTTTYATAADAGAVSFTNVQGTDKVTASASIVGGSNSTSGHLKAGSYQQTATAINGDDAANYSFGGITTADNNYVVNKLALTGAAIAGVTTTYATAADVGAVSFGNVKGADQVTASASIVGGSNSTSGNLKAGSYQQTATSVSGEDAANYSFGGFTTTDNNYVVNKLALNGAAIAGVATTYATAANTGTVSFTNVQGTDKVTASASIVGGSNSTSGHLKAGSYQQTATAINGDDAANYSFGGITTADNNYVVDKKSISLSGITAASKVYDASNAATVSVSGAHFNGQISSDELSVTSTGTFSDKNAATGKTVTLVNTLGGADLGNYAITDQVTTTADISKKAITLSGITASNKTYDGNNVATISVTSANFGGKVSGDDLSVDSTGTFSDKNAATGKTVTLVNTLGGADLGNYTITDQVTTTADISKKAITLSGITASNKTYDGNNVAAVSVTSANFGGKVSGDDLSVDSTGTFSDKNAATGKTVTLVNTIGGADLGNYAITDQVTTTADISKKAITLSGITAASKTYDGNNVAAVSVTSANFSGKVSGDDLSVASTGTFSDKNVATGKTVTLVNTLGGADLGNYTITDQVTTTADISKKAITLSGITASNKTYDGNNIASVSVAGAVFKDMVVGDDLSVASTGTFGDKNAATGKTVTLVNTIGGADLGNYAITDQVTTTADISKKAITLSGITASNKTYDGSKAATVSVLSAVFKDMVEGDELTVASTGKFDDKNVATGKTVTLVNTLGGADLGNYSIADQANTTADISKKAITLSGITAANKTYDGNNVAAVSVAGAAFKDMVVGDDLSVASIGTFSDKNVGESKTVTLSNTLTGADLGNYTITDQSTTIANISKKDLHISGLTAANKVYDGNTQAKVVTGAAIFDGLVQDDVVTLSATGSFDTRHVGQSKPVVISTTLDGQDVGNYNITSQSLTTANITPAPLKIKATAVRKTYDGTPLANGTGVLVGVLAGAEAGDKIDQAGTLSFTDKNAGTGKTVTVKGARLIDGTLADVTGNYSIEYIDSVEGVIDRAQASISASAMSVTYNGQTQSQSAAVLSGFVSGDDVQAGGLASGRQVGSYASALTATGRDVGNYTITFNNAALQIGKKAASLSSLDQSVVYNGQTQSLVGTQGSGFVVGDDLIFGGLPSGRQVGQYTSALMVSGADAGNYEITYGHGKLTITPKDAWVSAQAQSVIYNGSTQMQSDPRQEGFIAGDDVVVTGAAQGRDAGSYASNLSVSGADVKNYTVRLQQADLRIQKAMLGFVGTTVSDKLADGNTVAQVKAGRITGLMGAESLNISAVTGRFADAAPGTDKAVEVVYGLSNGDHGGRASNYDWSPVVLKANITAPTVSNLVVMDSQAAKPTFSRLYFQGFGGLGGVGGVGAAMGQVNYSIRTQPAQACTPQKLEDCICERVVDSAMEICFPADQGRQAKR